MARGATGVALLVIFTAAGCRAGDKPQTGSVQAATTAPPAPMVGWSSGDQYTYRVELSSSSQNEASPTAVAFTARAALRLHPQVALGGVEVLAELLDVDVLTTNDAGAPLPAGLAQDLASPWGFELVDGTYRALRARGNVSPFALGILNTLAAGLQSPSRPDRADARGDAAAGIDHAEADASGTYRAHYVAGADPNELTRTKTAYDNRTLARANLPFGPLNATPAVIESKGTLKIRGDDLFSVGSHDVLEASLTATSKVRVTTDLALTLVDHTQRAPTDWAALRGSTIVLQPGRIPPQQGPDPYDLKLAADSTFPEALAAAEKESTPDAGSTVDPMSASAPDEATAGAREKTFATLVALLRTRPGTVALATKAIDRDSRARRVLIDALGAASTPESLAALVSYVQRTPEQQQQQRQPRDVREKAAFALIRTPHPNAASIDALVGLLGSPDVRSYAVLGLGTYSRRLREAGDVDQANRASDALVPLLGTARAEADRVEVLQGIANSGDGRAFPRVRPLVDDPDEAVRAAAVDAIRLMPNPEVDA
ncbi:MAG: hypothetical protein ACRENE_22245, partial [Polyangiaceae bacterium]